VRNWNLRLVATSNLLWGGISKENYALAIKDYTPSPGSDKLVPFYALDRYKPYVEVGYGVENIFRIGRVDFIHRLTYMDKPNAKPFGVKVSLQFKL
jgi:hypothetical protein